LREAARIEMVNQVKSHPGYKVLKQVKTLGPVRIEMVNQVKSHPGYKVLKQVKTLGPVRIAEIISIVRCVG
jgi:hypothetical protein